MSLSVLISVYAGERPRYLKDALYSIWENQTYKPAQIVLVKDGPINAELESEIERYQLKLGEILTVVGLEENVGLGKALNVGLEYCRHELVARMDTDDVSLPNRFEKQIEFMNGNPYISASSASIDEWDEELVTKINKRSLPSDPESVAAFAIRRSPLSHPVVIFRKSVIQSVGGYPELRKAQDYALWSLLITKGHRLANLPDTLLNMRSGNGLFARRGFRYFQQEMKLLSYQREIGFLTNKNYVFNAVIKFFLRLSPNFIKNWAYKLAR